jgi:hypothetical protein
VRIITSPSPLIIGQRHIVSTSPEHFDTKQYDILVCSLALAGDGSIILDKSVSSRLQSPCGTDARETPKAINTLANRSLATLCYQWRFNIAGRRRVILRWLIIDKCLGGRCTRLNWVRGLWTAEEPSATFGFKPTTVIQLRHCSIGLRMISSPADDPDGGDERSGVDRCRCDGLSCLTGQGQYTGGPGTQPPSLLWLGGKSLA